MNFRPTREKRNFKSFYSFVFFCFFFLFILEYTLKYLVSHEGEARYGMKGDMVAGGCAREAAVSSDEIRLYFPTWLVKYAEFSEDYRGIRTLHALLPVCVLSTETYTFDLHFSFCCLFFGASTSSYAAISAGDGEAEEPEKCGYIYSKAFSAFTYSELGVRFESVCAPTFYM